MKVDVTSWRPVGYWVWDVKDPEEVCGICQNNFDGTCATCRVPGKDCPISVGLCSHVFHTHCLSKWLQTNLVCPLCKRDWRTSTFPPTLAQWSQPICPPRHPPQPLRLATRLAPFMYPGLDLILDTDLFSSPLPCPALLRFALTDDEDTPAASTSAARSEMTS